MKSEELKRQLFILDTECTMLGYTYTFDGTLYSVYALGQLKSTWTVNQVYRGEVYV